MAFSLGRAEAFLSQWNITNDFRLTQSPLYQLGGITKLMGAFLSGHDNELILIGQHLPSRPMLTLDDLAVALRSRMVSNAWPVVSLDPYFGTDRLKVRLEGGIEDTQFGADLLKADYRLKEIGEGLAPTRIEGLRGGFDASLAEHNLGDTNATHRFWFFPRKCDTIVRDTFTLIRGLEMAVGYQAYESANPTYDLTASVVDGPEAQFARDAEENFAALCDAHVEFSRLLQLTELFAVVRALEALNPQPRLRFWLYSYSPEHISTPRTIPNLWRKGSPFTPLGLEERVRYATVGGVKMTTLALRYRGGDVVALKESVIRTRPTPESLSWSFLLGNRLEPTMGADYVPEDVDQLRSSAASFLKQGDFSSALPFVNCLLAVQPRDYIALAIRGAVNRRLGRFDRALSDSVDSLIVNSNQLQPYLTIGSINFARKRWPTAIATYLSALQYNPTNAFLFHGLGWSRQGAGDAQGAIDAFDKAIFFSPDRLDIRLDRAWINIARRRDPDRALADLSNLVALWPNQAIVEVYLGVAYDFSRRIDDAKAHYRSALMLNERKELSPRETDTLISRVGMSPRLAVTIRQRLAAIDRGWTPVEAPFLLECLKLRK